MSARYKPAGIGEIQILRDQKASLTLCSRPNIWIALPCKRFFYHRMHIVTQGTKLLGQRYWHVLVKFDLHAGCGNAGTGKSSSAEAAAKAITART